MIQIRLPLSTRVPTGKGLNLCLIMCEDAVKTQAWMALMFPCGPMTPFHAAVLLTLSSIPRLQQSAWSILKVPPSSASLLPPWTAPIAQVFGLPINLPSCRRSWPGHITAVSSASHLRGWAASRNHHGAMRTALRRLSLRVWSAA